MTTKVFIGRFQPFHKGHLYTLLHFYKNSSKMVIVPIYYKRDGIEHLSSKNPIPISYRVRYIDDILSRYFPRDKYVIYPLKLDKGIVRNFVYLLRSIGDEEYVIFTRDLSRYLIFSTLKFLLMSNFKIRVFFYKEDIVSSSKIREAIRENKYDSIRGSLLKDLDEKTIEYIKRFPKGERDLDYVLRILF